MVLNMTKQMIVNVNEYNAAVAAVAAAPAEATRAAGETEKKFAEGLSFYKMVWVFALSSALGVVIEMIFCFIFKGYLECRQGMLYGPFNQVYGFAAVILSLLLYKLAKKNLFAVFVVGALAGGAFEVVCSYVQERTLGTVSWDYRWMSFISLAGGRTNLLYMVFFGVLGVVYIRFLYPAISRMVESISLRPGTILSWVIVVFMSVNLCLSAVVVSRWTERQTGAPAASRMDEFIDDNYPDEMLQVIYPSMVIKK